MIFFPNRSLSLSRAWEKKKGDEGELQGSYFFPIALSRARRSARRGGKKRDEGGARVGEEKTLILDFLLER